MIVYGRLFTSLEGFWLFIYSVNYCYFSFFLILVCFLGMNFRSIDVFILSRKQAKRQHADASSTQEI